MGEIANDALNGLTCLACGVWMPGVEEYMELSSKEDWSGTSPFDSPPGYPRTCPDCKESK